MSTVKFECPSCGQHMECDRARSGDVIHCVGCCAELRIPFSSTKTGLSCIERAELILPGAAPSAPGAKETRPAATPQKSPSSAIAPLEATCPICQAHLRFDPQKCPDSSSPDHPPTAELIARKEPGHKPQARHEQPHPLPANAEPADNHHLSFEEREKQIAEGRKAHPIQLYPAQKPRLDYILSGGTNLPGKGQREDAPETGEDEPGRKPHNTTSHCHDDSFSE
jgi:hypothetical protein